MSKFEINFLKPSHVDVFTSKIPFTLSMFSFQNQPRERHLHDSAHFLFNFHARLSIIVAVLLTTSISCRFFFRFLRGEKGLTTTMCDDDKHEMG